MDATNQTAEPLRSVRRGRPPKVAAVEMPIKAPVEIVVVQAADAGLEYGQRIWDGQSPDLPVSERVARINAALIAQGFPGDFAP